MSTFQLSNGEQLYYEDTQKGDHTIVMLHGWSSNSQVYAPVVPKISAHARVITYDHRGHGRSKDANRETVTMDTLAQDLNEIIEKLGLSDITLLGWSMGAGVTMNYASIYGCDKLRQIILCDMTPKQLNEGDWKLGLYKGKYGKEDMEKDAGKDFYSLYKAFAVAAIPKLRFVPGFLLKKPLQKVLDNCDETVLRSLSKSMKEKDFRHSVAKINVPLTYFYAVPGSLFSPKLAGWYQDHVTSPYRSVPFVNSTHMLINDHPDQFADEVIKVLKEGY